MSGEPAWHEEVVLPVLLGAAREVYGNAIRKNLAEAGFDDMPPVGARAVGGIARFGTLRNVSEELGISKQAASQLVDTLVLRGYVERIPDDVDRRRVQVDLTDRGRAAAEVIRAAVDRLDEALADTVGSEALVHTRTTLGALVGLGRHD